MMTRLTTNSIASAATIAIVSSGNAAITTVVAAVVVSTIGIVAIVVATVTSVAANSNIAPTASAPCTALLVVVACNAIDRIVMLADIMCLQEIQNQAQVIQREQLIQL